MRAERASGLRLDRLLYFLRLAPTRTRAHEWVCEGHIRRNGERATDPARPVQPGDVLTLPLARKVLIVELLALPHRRGPKAEAATYYRVLDAGRALRQSGREGPGSGADRGPDVQ